MEKIITLVTGGNQGMGLEIVRELAKAGQTVIMGSRSLENGQAALTSLSEEVSNVDVVQLDVTDEDSIDNVVEYIDQKYGYLSILINNAGASADKHLDPSEMPIEYIRQDFEVNFFGLIQITQKLLPLLCKFEGNGRIINVSSMMGSHTAALLPGSEVYGASAVGYQASKSAVNMFTIQLAKEMEKKQYPISVNAVDPGRVATNFGGTTPEHSKNLGAKTAEQGVARTVHLATASNIDTATFSNTEGIVPW